MLTKEFEFKDFDYPGKEIHYSDLAVWRQCPARFNFMMSGRVEGTKHPKMLLGSMLHNAFEVCTLYKGSDTWFSEASNPEWWMEQLQFQLVKNPEDVFDIDAEKIEQWALQFCNPDLFYGKTLASIVLDLYNWLNSMGLKLESSELKLRYGKFVGTLDILASRGTDLAIIDIKTTGMWDRLLDGKSITKQSYTDDQITHHPQLKHYHWMTWRSGRAELEDIKYYGIGLPANIIPYSTGKNKGKHRGIPYQIQKVSPRAVKRYEEDLFEWLRQIEDGIFVRKYPNVYGKIECPRCPFMEECLGDQDSSFVPEWIK